mmetsp:Transcript_9351/g.8254  ORF Transcript_9351/g.8254 Transcript_9351/m.8254 type:complete len:337 (+) Transcript_9351:31-1041(+)
MDERILVGGFAAICLILAYSCSCIWSVVFYIGLIRLITLYSSIAHFINKFFIRKRLDLISRYGEGSYALITGGANGIGLEYALQLAATGFNLILIDLDGEGLDRSKKQILEKSPNSKIETITCNLVQMTTPESYEELLKAVDDLDISIVMNNAGIADYHTFHETKPQSVSNVIQVNAVAVLAFTKIFYNRLLKREQRSAIVNMSSGVGLASNKLVPIYPSTKAFVKYLTEGLNEEAQGKMDFLYVYPGAVSTNSTGFRKALDSCTPDVIATNVLNSLGQDQYTAGYWLHDIGASGVESMFYSNRDLYRFAEDFAVEKTGLGKDLRDIAVGQDKKNK